MSTIQPNAPMSGIGEPDTNRHSKNELSPDDFIKLFLAQMRNQNPLKPADNTAILQQMSEVSTISASKDMQKTLTGISNSVNMALGHSQLIESTQLIGKKVQILSQKSPLSEEGLSGSVVLPNAASEVTVAIKDASGNTIKTIHCGAATRAGLLDFNWDGMGDDGKKYDPDFYTLSAQANINGKLENVYTAGAFKVNSVGLNQRSGGAIINVEGLGGTEMNDILKIV